MSEVKKRATDDGCSIVLHQTNDGHHHWLCPNCKRENVSPVGVIDLDKFLPSVVCSECGFEFGVDKSALPVTETNQPDLIAEVEDLAGWAILALPPSPHYAEKATFDGSKRIDDLLRRLVAEVKRLRTTFGAEEAELNDVRRCDKCDLCEDHHGN